MDSQGYVSGYVAGSERGDWKNKKKQPRKTANMIAYRATMIGLKFLKNFMVVPSFFHETFLLMLLMLLNLTRKWAI